MSDLHTMEMRTAASLLMRMEMLLTGSLILYVCGKYMKEHGQLKDDTIVTTIMSNLGLYKSMRQDWHEVRKDTGRRQICL